MVGQVQVFDPPQSSLRGRPLVEPNPRVNNGIENVPNQGGQHHQNGGDEQQGHHNGPIIPVEGVDEQPPHAGVVEDRLGDDGPAEDAGDLEHHDGDEGNQGVAGGMFDDNHPFAQPFGAGGAHVILAQHFQHGGAHEAAPASQVEQGQDANGQEEMDDPVGQGARLDAEQILDAAGDHPGGEDVACGKEGEAPLLKFDPKQDDGEQAEPKDGHGDAEEAEGGDGVVEPGVLAHGRDDANGQGDEEGDDGDAAHQDEGVVDAAADDGSDGLAPSQGPGLAPIPAGDAAATGVEFGGVGPGVAAAGVLAGGGLVVAPGAGFEHFLGGTGVADGVADFIEPIFAEHPGGVGQVDWFVEAEGGFEPSDVFFAESVFGVGGQVEPGQWSAGHGVEQAVDGDGGQQHYQHHLKTAPD